MDRKSAIENVKSWNLDSDSLNVLSVLIPELKENCDSKTKYIPIKIKKGDIIDYYSFNEIKRMVVSLVIDSGDGNPLYEGLDGECTFHSHVIGIDGRSYDEDIDAIEKIIQYINKNMICSEETRHFFIEHLMSIRSRLSSCYDF